MPRVNVEIAYSTIRLHSRKSRAQAFSKVLCIFEIWYERSGRVCFAIQARGLCDGCQLMYFICSGLSCQAMFRVVSNWLYSFSVVFRRDMNTKVLVLSCRNSFPQNLKVPCSSFSTKNCWNTEFMAPAPSGR